MKKGITWDCNFGIAVNGMCIIWTSAVWGGNSRVPSAVVMMACTSVKHWTPAPKPGVLLLNCQLSLLSGRTSLELVSRYFRKELAGASPCSPIKQCFGYPCTSGMEGEEEKRSVYAALNIFIMHQMLRQFLVGLKHLWHNWLENKQAENHVAHGKQCGLFSDLYFELYMRCIINLSELRHWLMLAGTTEIYVAIDV